MTRLGAALLLLLTMGCSTGASEARNPPAPAAAAVTTTAPSAAPAEVAPKDETSMAPLAPVAAVYPWAPSATAPADRLDGRFRTPPAGFTRVSTARGSFGEFLRTLPLAPEGAPVVDFRGNKLHDNGRHPNIVAIADLDVGTKDLQHCADAIIRLHAEWRYGRGERDLTYRAVSGQPLSYKGYVAGDRAIVDGKDIVIKRAASARKDDHALLRGWLDDVFSWAGTASLERDAKKVAAATEMMPGDFFVMSGSPFGHAVLILDVAKDDTGRTALLLGQSYMPAQSFQVLRPHEGSASPGSRPWFIVEPGDIAVATPFWRPFPMSALRRFG